MNSGLIRSWVKSANAADCPFPLNNLPCGVFSVGDEELRCGVAIGDYVLDVTGLEEEGLLSLAGGPLLDVPFWNEVMGAGPAVWADLRGRLTALLAEGSADQAGVEPFLVPLAEVAHMPQIDAFAPGSTGNQRPAKKISAKMNQFELLRYNKFFNSRQV